MSMKSLLCVIACAGWIGIGTAAAAKTRVAGVVLAIDRELDAEAVAAGIALRQMLKADPRREAVDLDALALGEGYSQSAKTGNEHLAQALESLDRMREKAALEKADEAIRAFEDADLARAFAGLLDSLAARALALYSEGNKEAMRAELVKLYALRADYELDSDRAPPDVPPVVAEARAEVSRAPRANLEVTSEPVPAEVFVDGVYRGIGGVSVPDLAPGRHFLTLRALGYELAQQAVIASPGRPRPIRLTLTPAAGARGLLEVMERLRKSSPPGADGSGAALAEWASADETLVVVLKRKGKGTWAQAALAAADGKVLVVAEGAMEKPDEVLELARSVLGGRGDRALVESTRPRRTLAYAFGGAAVAALGAGVAFGAIAKKDFERAKILQWDPDRTVFERTKAAAVRERALANIGFGVGAAAVGVGLYFAISRESPEGEKNAHFIAVPVRGGGAMVLAGRF